MQIYPRLMVTGPDFAGMPETFWDEYGRITGNVSKRIEERQGALSSDGIQGQQRITEEAPSSSSGQSGSPEGNVSPPEVKEAPRKKLTGTVNEMVTQSLEETGQTLDEARTIHGKVEAR